MRTIKSDEYTDVNHLWMKKNEGKRIHVKISNETLYCSILLIISNQFEPLLYTLLQTLVFLEEVLKTSNVQ